MEISVSPEQSDRELLDAVVDFVLTYPDASLAPFYDNLRHWGDEWRQAKSVSLSITRLLTAGLSSPVEQIDALLRLFMRHSNRLCWEQGYKKEDGLVGDDMLNNYGFVEVVGKRGPFVSEKIRCGIGVWGPRVIYPIHVHKAEEIYLVMSGSALFKLGEGQEEKKTPGEVIHVRSMLPHGFRTTDDPLVILYLWQAGDLREKPTFV